MPEVQITGDSKNLPKAPQSEVPSGRVQGGQVQMSTAENIKLSRTPVSSAPKLGIDSRVQTVAEKVVLGTVPVKGLGSASAIPMSERAVKQSK